MIEKLLRVTGKSFCAGMVFAKEGSAGWVMKDCAPYLRKIIGRTSDVSAIIYLLRSKGFKLEWLCLLIAVFIAGSSITAEAQCVSDATHQCVPNETLNRMNKALDELAAARDLITKQAVALATSDAKAAVATEVINKANQILALDTKIIESYDKVIQIYRDALELYSNLVDKLTAKIDAPKSAWAKFASALKTIANIALGIIIGRASF